MRQKAAAACWQQQHQVILGHIIHGSVTMADTICAGVKSKQCKVPDPCLQGVKAKAGPPSFYPTGPAVASRFPNATAWGSCQQHLTPPPEHCFESMPSTDLLRSDATSLYPAKNRQRFWHPSSEQHTQSPRRRNPRGQNWKTAKNSGSNRNGPVVIPVGKQTNSRGVTANAGPSLGRI